MLHQLTAWLYQRATGRPYWTEARPVDIRAMRDGLGPYLAVTPVRDDVWPNVFLIVHTPTGRPVVGAAGCISCCRRAARELAAAGADWAALRVDNRPQWLAAAPDEVRRVIADYRLGLGCDAGPGGQPCPVGGPVVDDEDLAVAS